MRKSRMALWIVIGAFCSGAIATIPTLASGALASGAAPPPPAVSSVAATHVTGSGARLNGAINPNGQQTTYAFQWGPTTGYGHETPLTSGGAGSAPESVSANLAGLDGGSTYHFRVIAINASGTSVGADESFTTSGTRPSPSAAPSATTTEATGVNQAGATLNGTDNPNGQATTYYFEYGPTTNYGYETGPVAAGSGKTAQAATATLGGLPSGATAYYRLVAVTRAAPRSAPARRSRPRPRRRSRPACRPRSPTSRCGSTACSTRTGSRPPSSSNTGRPPHTGCRRRQSLPAREQET